LKKRLYAAISWLILICILTLTPGNKLPKDPGIIPHFDKMIHLFMFFILSILWITSVAIDSQNKFIKKNILLISLIGTFLACILEYMQKYIPNRSFDFVDMLMNVAGVLLGILFFKLFSRKFSIYL